MSGKRLLIGMLHLPPLPGAPRNELPLAGIEERVVAEARTLQDFRFDAAILENFGDTPFYKDEVDVATIAFMTRLACAVRTTVPGLSLGINVLRNDARAALVVAASAEAHFIRINVHVGATATDQGIIEGQAASTLRRRAAIASGVALWADVRVKHGRSLAHASIEEEAEDAVARGLADAIIVTGPATGKETSLEDLRRVKSLALGVPVFAGSGVEPAAVREVLEIADGVIVGSALKHGGRASNPIDPGRVERFVENARSTEGCTGRGS